MNQLFYPYLSFNKTMAPITRSKSRPFTNILKETAIKLANCSFVNRVYFLTALLGNIQKNMDLCLIYKNDREFWEKAQETLLKYRVWLTDTTGLPSPWVSIKILCIRLLRILRR